jgi:hypothetical protein
MGKNEVSEAAQQLLRKVKAKQEVMRCDTFEPHLLFSPDQISTFVLFSFFVQGDDNSLVSRLLKNQVIPNRGGSDKLAVLPLIAKLPSIKKGNPFRKDNENVASEEGEEQKPTEDGANVDAEKRGDETKAKEDCDAAVTSNGTKVSVFEILSCSTTHVFGTVYLNLILSGSI